MAMLSRVGRENHFRFALLVMASGLLLLAAARAGTVYYEVDGFTTPANDIPGTTDPSLRDAMNAVNSAVTGAAAGPDLDVEKANALIQISGGQTAGASADPAGYWVLSGADAANYANDYGGFNSVAVTGIPATPGGQVLLEGDPLNDNMLLKVLHVADSITVENIHVSGGKYDGGLTEGIFGGDEVGGAGMTLGSNGVMGAHTGPQTIGVTNVTASGNHIIVDNTANTDAVNNAFGGGILVNAHGSTGAGVGGNHSQVTFTGVDLSSNSVAYTNNAVGDVSVRGGGSRVAHAERFDYTTGTVDGNTVTLILNDIGNGYNPHAAGGGLSVDGGSAFQGGRLGDVTFSGNVVTTANNVTNGEHPVTWARGGGFYFNSAGAAANRLLTFDVDSAGNGIAFTGNHAVATAVAGQQSHAAGGAAFLYLNDVDAVFTATQFANNTADASGADTGDGMGGALAVGRSGGLDNGRLEVSGASFQANEAKGSRNAMGGAVHVDNDSAVAHAFVDNKFEDNAATASGATGLAAGGAMSLNGVGHNLSGGYYEGNRAVASDAGGAADAFGGAVSFAAGDQVVADETYKNNSVATMGDGAARGGALYFADGDSAVTGTTLEGNHASTDGASGKAQGGAVFVNKGSLTLADTKVIGNRVAATGGGAAEGGAVFMNTEAGASRLDLVASGGGETVISGNYLGSAANASGVHFGVAGDGLGLSQGDAALNISGNGVVRLLDPVRVDMNNGRDFTMRKTGSGRLVWDGVNTLSAANGTVSVNLDQGVVELGADFTARAGAGTDAFNVTVGTASTGAEVWFDASRTETLAMFDFTGSANGSMTAEAGTQLIATAGHSITSFTKEFVVAEGLTSAEIDQLRNDIVFKTDGSGYFVGTYGLENRGGDTLVAKVRFDSPFERAGVNSRNAVNALDRVIRSPWGQANVSGAEVGAMYRNANNITPGMVVAQGNVMFMGVDRVARTAMDFGVRHPHRARMRMESSYRPSPSPRRSGMDASRQPYPAAPEYQQQYQGQPQPQYEYQTDPGFQQPLAADPGYQYQQQAASPDFQPFATDPYAAAQDYDPYAVQSGTAYPRLMDCYSAPLVSGLRFWTGYIGDWGKVDSNNGNYGYRVDRHGFLIGANYDIGTIASVGFYGGYTYSKARARGADTEVKSDNGHFGLIGRLSPISGLREFSLYADMGYHFSTNDLTRGLGGWDAKGSFDQGVFTLGLGVEHVFRLGGFNLTPHAEARYSYLDQDDYSETGSSATVSRVNGYNANTFNHRVGLEASYDFVTSNMVITPAVNVDWRHDYGKRNRSATGSYLNDPLGVGYALSSAKTDRDSMDIGVAVKALRNVSRNTKVGFNLAYNFNVSRNTDTHSLYAGVELGF